MFSILDIGSIKHILMEGPLGIALIGPDLRFVKVNSRFCAMVGYSEEELLSKTFMDISHPDDIARSFSAASEMFRGESTGFTQDKRYFHKNGSVVWVRLFVSQVNDEGGRPLYNLAMMEEVTERKRANTLREESEMRLQLALENGGMGMFDWDAPANKVYYDKNWGNLLGYTSEELVQRAERTQEVIHPDDFQYVMDRVFTHIQTEDTPYEVEYRTRHKTKGWVWVNTRAKVTQRDADGKVLRVIGLVHEVTARKQAEQALRESENRFRLLADTAPVCIWTAGPDMVCDYVNRPYLELTGRTLEQETGTGWAESIHPEDAPLAYETFREAFEKRQTFRVEFRLRRFDGTYRWMLNTGTPRFTPNGTFLGYIGSGTDITDQKALQEQLFESQKLESMGRLAGGIAHDFNNLLTAILGYTELALSVLPEDAEIRPFLDNVSAASERAANLTKQLLMYARRQMVEFTTVDINRVILDMDPLFRRTVGEQYELVTVLSEEACMVNANASQMEQVLLNLVVNARDALPEDGGRILIETMCVTLDADYALRHIGVAPGNYVLFSVSDNGTGMTDEVRSRIFEPFYTTKEVGKGTGLGLATCYGIVKQSRGNIWVYSEPGVGTTMKVYLPRVYEVAAVAGEKYGDGLPEGTETVLLVDDEPMVRDIAARTLRAQGYRVLEASNGAEALHVQQEWSGTIDLLLTDVVMPLMGGKELAQRLQALHPTMKVLYMSGYTQNVVLQQGVLKTGLLLLTKPFTAAGLSQKVREALTAE